MRARKWAEAAHERTKGAKPWPEYGGLVSAMARKTIADLLPTTELGNRMLRHAYEVAQKRYEELRGMESRPRTGRKRARRRKAGG